MVGEVKVKQTMKGRGVRAMQRLQRYRNITQECVQDQIKRLQIFCAKKAQSQGFD